MKESLHAEEIRIEENKQSNWKRPRESCLHYLKANPIRRKGEMKTSNVPEKSSEMIKKMTTGALNARKVDTMNHRVDGM